MYKLCISVFLFVLAVLGVLSPVVASSRTSSKSDLMPGCNALASGILIAASIVHMLPEASEQLAPTAEAIRHLFGSEESFPLAPTLVGTCFFGILLLELYVQRVAAVATCKAAKAGKTMISDENLHDNDILSPSASSAARVTGERSPSSALAMLVALSVHSILEGVGIGVQGDVKGVSAVVFAVGAHKSFAGFALGSQLHECGFKDRVFIYFALLFSLCTPVGIALGTLLAEDSESEWKGAMLALASGTFLYIGIVEMLLPTLEIKPLESEGSQ
eukprot:gene6282-7532_t